MKNFFYQFLRSLTVLLIGILLVACKEQWTQWVVVLSGAVFFIVGLMSVFNYLLKKNRGRPAGNFPVLGIGGILLGIILMVAAESFVNFFMYVMGVALIIVAVYQFVTMLRIHRVVRLHAAFFLAPVLALMFGVFALWNPTKVASIPFLLTGLGCIVSAVGDIIALSLYGSRRAKDARLERKTQREAAMEVAEEVESGTPV